MTDFLRNDDIGFPLGAFLYLKETHVGLKQLREGESNRDVSEGADRFGTVKTSTENCEIILRKFQDSYRLPKSWVLT